MRETTRRQLPLVPPLREHSHVAELEQMSRILDANPEVAEAAYAELVIGVRADRGAAAGLSADQVVRSAICKGGRETIYGHKICLTAGVANLITDCVILEGNPADTSLAVQMMKRHVEIFGSPPEQAAFDGGFASKDNLDDLKDLGIEDVAFSKRRELAVLDMVRSSWVYKRLRNFRAGIEGIISFLKRGLGLDRCRWRGLRSFEAYTWSAIVAANLLVLSRHMLD